MVAATLYGWSPVAMHGWRATLLKLFGAKIQGRVFVYPSTDIWAPWNLSMADGSCLGPRVICYSVGGISLAEHALVSQGSHLCSATHDHRDPKFPLVVGAIAIGPRAWIAADAFVGPGVTVGERAVVGARSVVMKDVPAGIVVAGNPATPKGPR
ncbi:MAG: putative colanic acid biosynthesis acetyltransferase [Pseudomonadota bacterium]